MFTYYVDVTVCGMFDMYNYADLMWRGGIFQGTGNIYSGEVPIRIEDRSIYFDLVYADKNSKGTTKEKIEIVARIDDMYFVNSNSAETPIGGKSVDYNELIE